MVEATQSIPMAQPQATQQAPPPGCEHTHSDDKCSNQEFLHVSPEEWKASFSDIWSDVTSDNRLTLFGFKRYRTAHLINLRYLALEIDKIDHVIFQAGLQANQSPSYLDRLGLRYVKLEPGAPTVTDVVNHDTFLRLRRLIKEYDEALLAFNDIMSLETFALADNISKASQVRGMHPCEKFKTRLVRVDLAPRGGSRDPIQHYLRKGIRRLWYYLNITVLADLEQGSLESLKVLDPSLVRIWGNTARLAEIFTRFLIALVAGAALVCPLAILSYQPSTNARLLVVVVCIVIFCFIVSTLSKATHYEAMAVSAAYAAVLTVFLSNNPGS